MRRIAPNTKVFSRQLRGAMTDAEKHLWRHLRMRQMAGMKFRRQHPLGVYLLDFVCLEAKLVIEVDGGQHAEQTDADRGRTAWIELQGFKVLRFWNHEVLQEIESVTRVIFEALTVQSAALK